MKELGKYLGYNMALGAVPLLNKQITETIHRKINRRVDDFYHTRTSQANNPVYAELAEKLRHETIR